MKWRLLLCKSAVWYWNLLKDGCTLKETHTQFYRGILCCCWITKLWTFANLWTIDCHARISEKFSRPGKDTGVSWQLLLQGVFLTQGSNPHLLLGRWILYHRSSRVWNVWVYLKKYGFNSDLTEANEKKKLLPTTYSHVITAFIIP